jgi:hypothetical protein
MKTMQKRTFLTTAAAVVASAATALTAPSAHAAKKQDQDDKDDRTVEGLIKRLAKVHKTLEKAQDELDDLELIPCGSIPCGGIPCDLLPEFLESLKNVEAAAQGIVDTVEEIRDAL